jgi:type I restriction enzyme, S subunit
MSEIKDIPAHWEIKKLGDVVDKLSLNKIKIKQRDYLQQGKFPVVDQGQALVGGYFNDDNFVVPSEPPYIIFGDHTKVKKFINFKFIAGADGVKVLKPKSNIDPRFLYYAIHTIKIDDKGYARHFQLLEKSDIPLPPLPEQQAIVAKIEELLSELDNGKQQLQTALQQLKVYRQSLLKWAFEGKLTNTNVKEGELPDGWKWVKPEEIAIQEKYSIGIGPFGSNLKVSDYQPSGVPLIFVKNITRRDFSLAQRFISKDKLKELYPHAVRPLDILITKMGDPPGDCAIYPESYPEAVITSDCLKLRVNEKVASRNFIYYVLQTQLIKRQFELITKGVAQKKISLQRFKSIEMPLPPLEEQQLIVDELESKLTICDNVEETIKLSLQQAETLRQSILKKAFEGKLV